MRNDSSLVAMMKVNTKLLWPNLHFCYQRVFWPSKFASLAIQTCEICVCVCWPSVRSMTMEMWCYKWSCLYHLQQRWDYSRACPKGVQAKETVGETSPPATGEYKQTWTQYYIRSKCNLHKFINTYNKCQCVCVSVCMSVFHNSKTMKPSGRKVCMHTKGTPRECMNGNWVFWYV